MSEWLTAILMLTGAGFMLLAAVGIMRLPDTFTRMQAATKAVTLGVSSMMLATATHFADLGVTVRALTTVLFLFATAPVAAHLIGRVAYFVGAQMWEGTQFDELGAHHSAAEQHGGDDKAPPEPRENLDDDRVRRSASRGRN